MKRLIFFLAAVSSAFLWSCDDTTDTIGETLTTTVNSVTVSTDTFRVESHSTEAKDIVSYTATGYFGKVKDPETGSYLTASYMTQFLPMGDNQFPVQDSIYLENLTDSANFANEVYADSCCIVFYIPDYYGDSTAVQKMILHEMGTPYEEGEVYKTDFNPIENNMLRTDSGSIHKQAAFTLANQRYSVSQDDYVAYIMVRLDEPYTDTDGVTYNNLGTYFMRKYYNSDTKKNFYSSYLFNHNIFPGVYLEHAGGLGSLASIVDSELLIYYMTYGDSTTVVTASGIPGTEEVLQKTYLSQNQSKISELVADTTCTYLKSPAGIFTELTLPIEDIVLGRDNETTTHENDTLNTVRLFISRINDSEYTQYNLPIPSTLLMVPSDSAVTFFTNHETADARDTYISSYSSSTNGYTFANIAQLITQQYDLVEEEVAQAIASAEASLGTSSLSDAEAKQIKKNVISNYKAAHPNWDKVMLIPVETTYSTLSSSSSVLTKVIYDMSLSSTRLIKGDKTNDNISVSVIYSKFGE